MPTPVIALRLDPIVRAQLEKAAERNELSTSERIRRAIEDYLGADGGRTIDVLRAQKVLRRSRA